MGEQGAGASVNDLRIGDRYEVIDVLGQGGFGSVLKARHSQLNKIVAIKVLNVSLVKDETMRKRFELEAQAGSNLSHPHLVAVFDYGFTQLGEPYLVMEYVDGYSLYDYLAKSGKLPLADIVHVFIQVSKALQYLHGKNIIHRDLKPHNVMVHVAGEEKYAKLIDLGISKVFTEEGKSLEHLTATGAVFGTPQYMSPEQCRGMKADTRSDIYSLGCVLYQCFSGVAPFVTENPLQTIFKHVTDEPEPIATTTAAEGALVAIIQRCMKKDPEQRFQSAGDVGAALEQVESLESARLSGKHLSTENSKFVGKRLANESPQPGAYQPGVHQPGAHQPTAARQAAPPAAPAPPLGHRPDSPGVATPINQQQAGAERFRGVYGTGGDTNNDGGADYERATGEHASEGRHPDVHGLGRGTREGTRDSSREGTSKGTRERKPDDRNDELADLMKKAKKISLIVGIVSILIGAAYKLYETVTLVAAAIPRVQQLKTDTDAAYERTHRELEKYNNRP